MTLAGRNLFVTDSDIYSSGDVVGTRGNGDDIGAAYMHIARNTFYNGGATHYGISWKQSIFEDNVATGVSPTGKSSRYLPSGLHSSQAAISLLAGWGRIIHSTDTTAAIRPCRIFTTTTTVSRKSGGTTER